jgi:hypothetical protein
MKGWIIESEVEPVPAVAESVPDSSPSAAKLPIVADRSADRTALLSYDRRSDRRLWGLREVDFPESMRSCSWAVRFAEGNTVHQST